MNYAQLNTYLQTITEDQDPSSDYTTIFPAVIQDAENRIYRELDFIATRTIEVGAFSVGNRIFTLPTSPFSFLVIQGVAQITPVPGVLTTESGDVLTTESGDTLLTAPPINTDTLGTESGDTITDQSGNAIALAALPTPGPNDVYNQLEAVSLDFIDMVWPRRAVTGLGQYWAMLDANNIVVAPTPDAPYTAEITGIYRPSAISATNTETYISTVYPDLLVAACMVFLTGYMKNFGAQSDDPKMAMSWEQLYQSRMKSALEEEQRRKWSSTGWAPFSQTMATPARA